MLIKKDSSKFLSVLLQSFRNSIKPILIYIPIGMVIGVLLVCSMVVFLSKTGELYTMLDTANLKFYEATDFNVYGEIIAPVVHPINFFAGLRSKPEHITIDIGFEDFKKLAYKRMIALASGILIASDEDFVPATIRYEDRVVGVRLRLKGDLINILVGDKWPFRIRVVGDNTIFGMKKFSTHKPEARHYINEWLFHQALKREGIVSIRYEFIEVTINGDNKGIYALEEHFEKRLVEHNGYREGPILKLNGDIMWADTATSHGQDLSNPIGLQSMYSADIDVFRKDTTIADATLYNQYILGMNLLESFRNGSLRTHQVFDIDKLAKFMALTDLMGAYHGLAWNNMRFYYNPITSLLEPIGFDAEPRELHFGNILAFDKLIGVNDEKSIFPQDNKSIVKIMFYDPIFFKRYIQALEHFSQKSYLDSLFADVANDLKRNINILYKDNPVDVFSKDVFYYNQDLIIEALNPFKGLHAYFYQNTVNNSITLEVGNIQPIPIEILNVSYQDNEIFKPEQDINILQAKKSSEPVKYERIEFMLPDSFNWSEQYIPDLKINYKLLGASRMRNETIFPWSHLSEDFLATDFIRQKPNIEEFDFLAIDSASARILVKRGDWEIADDIIIPPGYTVVAVEGTELNLKNNARILSYSSLRFYGSEDNPISITSSDSSGQGITVLNAGEWSILENVIFKNLSAPSQSGWQLTGAITFYESPVEITSCQFIGNTTGDDMLNIIRSEFNITGSLFKQALFDALDIDFSKGTISRTAFISSGNDGIDISGSVVDINDGSINGAGDKGISVGENSQVMVEDVKLASCYVAVASKDMSRVLITNVTISSCEVGLAVYQKKPEFGPSIMEVSYYTLEGVPVPYLCEENSTLTDLVNDEEFVATQKNVYQILYGEE